MTAHSARLAARVVGITLVKSLVFAVPVGAWAFGYYLLALDACFSCSVGAALTYAAGAAILTAVFVLWFTNSSWGRLQMYLGRIRRPRLRLLLVIGFLWGLGHGVVVFAATGRPRALGAVLAAWLIAWLTLPRLFAALYGRQLELR